MPDTLIIHDGRLPGGLGATVLARLLRRSGQSVYIESLGAGQSATSFWRDHIEAISKWRTAGTTKVILFGITFYDIDPDLCKRSLQLLLRTFAEVEVWSHRWPDGYYQHLNDETLSGIRILIPPDDIVYGPLGVDLQAHEKLLLRLSLVAARAIPIAASSPDLGTTRSLKAWVYEDPSERWQLLLESQPLEQVISEALSTPSSIDVLDGIDYLENFDSAEGTAEFSIHSRRATQEVDILETICDSDNIPASAVILVWLGDDRVLLYRRDFEMNLPSLRWLMKTAISPTYRLALLDSTTALRMQCTSESKTLRSLEGRGVGS